MNARREVWLLALGVTALFLGLAWYLAPLEPGVLSLQLTFTPRAFGQIVHTWTPEQLERYRAHFPADFVLLVAYARLGHALASRGVFAARDSTRARWLLPAAAACDAMENALHLWLTAAPRLDTYWPYPLAGAAAGLKWLLILGFAIWVWVVLKPGRRES